MLDILLFVSFAIGVPWCIWFTLGLKSGTMAAMLAPGLVAAGLMLTISPLKLGNSPLVRFGEPKYALLAWCVPVAWVVALAGLNLLLRTGSLWPPSSFTSPETSSTPPCWVTSTPARKAFCTAVSG